MPYPINLELTLLGGGIGLCTIPVSNSEFIDEILSVDLPFESRGLGAGGGGFCGRFTKPILSFFGSWGMTSLPKAQLRSVHHRRINDLSPICITDRAPELESLLGERLWV